MRIYKQKKPDGSSYKKWTIEVVDHLGTRRKFTGFPDKGASSTLGAKLEKLVSFRTAKRHLDADLVSWLESLPASMLKRLATIGLIDSETTAASKPLMVAKKEKRKLSSYDSFYVTGGHLLDYKQHMQSRELDKGHVRRKISYCSRFISTRRLVYPTDISTTHVEAFLTSLREQGLSARTNNAALYAIRGFCRWMQKEGRITTDPTAKVSKLNEKTDRRRPRRALTASEISKLIDVTLNGEMHHGLTGRERSLVYRLALTTGLRHNEIRTLARSDFDLSGHTPSVTIRAENEKAGRGDRLPVKSDLAIDLSEYFASNPALPTVRAFRGMQTKGAEMLRQDMKAADIAWQENDQGEIVDFHSLWHTFGTMLAKSGIHPKACQDLMRHSDINLTMGLYTHTMLDDRSKAINSLPDFSGSVRELKTGTADIPENGGYLQGDLQGHLQGQNLSKSSKNGDYCHNEMGGVYSHQKCQKKLEIATSGTSKIWSGHLPNLPTQASNAASFKSAAKVPFRPGGHVAGAIWRVPGDIFRVAGDI
ncbi:MAG: tyrosine-type recombinase/integrase [Planctomycetes bacterium]|nr:tyrosine-type recombinase/integrase [Planctomycetota bacterium]